MARSFRFLIQFTTINLLVTLGCAAVVTLGTALTGGTADTNNMFSMYFGLFPLMGPIMLYLFAFSLCTSNLNMALSFGARRRDFFWALQGIMLVYTAAFWALQLVMTALPPAFGWGDLGRWYILLSMGDQPWWVYPLVCLTSLAVGCLSGLVFVRSKLWGAILIAVACVGGVVAVVLLLLVSNKQVYALWGDLPWVLAAGMGAIFLVSELVIRRIVFRFSVR